METPASVATASMLVPANPWAPVLKVAEELGTYESYDGSPASLDDPPFGRDLRRCSFRCFSSPSSTFLD